MIEQLSIWEPITNSKGLYCLYALRDSEERLELMLIHDKIRSRKMHISFGNPVYAYRSTNETLVYGYLSKRHESELDQGGSFFTVENSDFIKQFSLSNGGNTNVDKLKHFLFVTSDEITEVLSCSDPKVTWITYDLPQPTRNQDDE